MCIVQESLEYRLFIRKWWNTFAVKTIKNEKEQPFLIELSTCFAGSQSLLTGKHEIFKSYWVFADGQNVLFIYDDMEFSVRQKLFALLWTCLAYVSAWYNFQITN